MKLIQRCKHAVKIGFQGISNRYTAMMLSLWGFIGNAFAEGAGGGGGSSGPDINKLPTVKIPGVDSNTTDLFEILFAIGKGFVLFLAIGIAAVAILVVAKAAVAAYNQASDPNDKRGWLHFIIVIVVGLVMIFFTLWLVKLAYGIF